MNNRKYLQSTGVLLKSLNSEESAMNTNFNGASNGRYGQAPFQFSGTSNTNSPNFQFNPNQFIANAMNNGAGLMGTPPLLNSLPNQFDIFANQIKMTNSSNSMQQSLTLNIPQNNQRWQQLQQPQVNKPQQQRWPWPEQQQQQQQQQQPVSNKSNKPQQQQQQRWPQAQSQPQPQQQPNQPYYNQYPSSKQSGKRATNQSMSPASQQSSSVAELPETFGLPSNSSKSRQSQNKKSSANQLSNSDISIDDKLIITSPTSTSSKTERQQLQQAMEQHHSSISMSNDDIEIIGEHLSSKIPSTTSFNQNASARNEDSALRSYLNKAYNNTTTLLITKPQSNFISNLGCIERLLAKCGSDLYNSKQRRCRPYSNIRSQVILTIENDLNGPDSEGEEENEGSGKVMKRLKSSNEGDGLHSTKCILIDDSNDDMLHKPWITPELIKLIKHRNLLQVKLTESGDLNAVTGGEATVGGGEQELLKKFRTLRNKVTKLVKKARKDYLAKYIKENKSTASAVKNSTTTAASGEENLKHVSTHTSTTTTATSTITTTTTTTTESNERSNTGSAVLSLSKMTGNAVVDEIVSTKLSTNPATFLKDQTTMMNNLYTTYYNDYMKQYTKQQEQMAAEATKAKESGNKNEESYDSLQRQASYYAEQQRAIQKQLETSLSQAAEQLIIEIANAAASKANQTPAVIPNPIQQQSIPFTSGVGQFTQSAQPPPSFHAMSMHPMGPPPPGLFVPPPNAGMMMGGMIPPPPPPTMMQQPQPKFY